MKFAMASAAGLAFVSLSLASGFPARPEGLTVKHIEQHPGVTISYKKTNVCETTAKAWSGYVNMPSAYLADTQDPSDPYNLSMFFFFAEARHDPENAPTAIYLAGGPGESSMYGVASDGGPCYVLPDSNSTVENPWSWNEYVNMLYVDQPNAVGFSYDTLINSTLDLLFLGGDVTDTGIVAFEAYNGSVPAANSTFFYGTLPSQSLNHTANNTLIAARTLWHFSQAWFPSFPEWKTCNKKISVWGNSYAGYTVPTTAAYMEQQNVKIRAGELTGSHVLELDTVGITNGCIDLLYQGGLYPEMAYNNTYGLQTINETVYDAAVYAWEKPGGCRDLTLECRELGKSYDSENYAINATVNEICVEAAAYCFEYVQGPFGLYSNRSAFDIAQFNPAPFPFSYVAGFFNQAWVQEALGAPVNFTATSTASNNANTEISGDPVRLAGMKYIEYLLGSGFKVALMYGDRDYRCPWLGAEALSLQANWTGANDFRAAGYQSITTNDTYHGGVVRQHGKFSFSRVFEAGHDVSAFQPETSFQVFNRVMFDVDIPTGKVPTNAKSGNYSTEGPLSSFHIKDKLPAAAPPVSCYLWMVESTCTEDQYVALVNGTAEIVNYTIVNPAGGGGAITFVTGL